MKDEDGPEEASVLMTCEIHAEEGRQKNGPRLVGGVGVEARDSRAMKPVTEKADLLSPARTSEQ